MTSLQEKIAKARELFEAAKPSVVEVEFAGEISEVGILPLTGEQWERVKAANPPRKGLDEYLGYNPDTAPASYPVERLTVDGEMIPVESWRDFYSWLAAPSRQKIAAEMFDLHHLTPAIALGKALTAKQGSTPA